MEIGDFFQVKTRVIRFSRLSPTTINIKQYGKEKMIVPEIIYRNFDEYKDRTMKTGKTMKSIFREYSSLFSGKLENNEMLINTLSEIYNAIQNKQLEALAVKRNDLLLSIQPCKLNDQIDELLNLYALFCCYRFLAWDDQDIEPAMRKYMRKYSTDMNPSNCLRELVYSTIDCNLVTHLDNSIELTYCLNSQGSSSLISEEITCNSLYTGLLLQLIMHIENGKNETDGLSIAECLKCHNKFIRKNGNKKYCAMCARNSERARDYRIRKKEATHE